MMYLPSITQQLILGLSVLEQYSQITWQLFSTVLITCQHKTTRAITTYCYYCEYNYYVTCDWLTSVFNLFSQESKNWADPRRGRDANPALPYPRPSVPPSRNPLSMIWASADLCRWVQAIKEARSRGRGRGPILKSPASTDTPPESQSPPEPSQYESPPEPFTCELQHADRNSTAFQVGRQINKTRVPSLRLAPKGPPQPMTSTKQSEAQALLSDHIPTLALPSS